MQSNAKPTFVFVHGAWHGAWCWSEVTRLLAERGCASLALDLPGHGVTARFPASYLAQPQDTAALSTEPSSLAALTLTDYRDAVLKVIRGLTAHGSGPVILVGHSLGGATISAVTEAAPELIRCVVYLTAFVPVRFPTVIQYLQDPSFSESEVPPLFIADPAVTGCGRINHRSADLAYRAADKSAFYGDVADDAFAAFANLLTPDEPIQGFTTPAVLTPARWGSVPRAYIRCTADRAIPIKVQDSMIAEADAFTPQNRFVVKTMTTSHSPFASDPAALAAELASLA